MCLIRKTTIHTRLRVLLCTVALLLLLPAGFAAANGLVYVNNVQTNSIGLYDLDTGNAINTNFITGLNHPVGIVVSGGKLYVTNETTHTVGLYDANTGAVINGSFISTGLNHPYGLALSGTIFT